MLGINLFFTALGLWLPLKTVEHLAYNAMTVWKWGTVASIVTQDIWGILGIIFDIGWFALTQWIAKQPWWTRAGWLGKFTGQILSNTWVINLVALGAQLYFGYLSLQDQGCFGQ
jgi:hypothetical protein